MTMQRRVAAGPSPVPPVAPRDPAGGAAPAAARRDRTPLLVALSCALVTLGVTGYRVGHRQLWEDEYSTWHASTMTLSQLRYLVSHIDRVLEPYYLFMHYWIRAFGDSATALRAPSVIAMSLTAGVLALIGRRLFDATVGVTAGLLFAAVPAISRYGQEARPYALAVFLATLATLLLLRALDRPTVPRWLLYAVCMIALAGAHIVAVVVLAAHALAVLRLALLAPAGSAAPAPSLLAAVRRRLVAAVRAYWRFAAAVVLILVVLVPFARAAHRQSYAIDWITVTRQSLEQFPAQLFGSQAIAVIVMVAALVGAVFSAVPAGHRQALVLLAGWALVPTLLILATHPMLHLFYYRYLLFTVPAWVLLAARGLNGLARAIVPRHRVAGLVVATAVALAAIGAVAVPGQRTVRQHLIDGSPDYSAVAGVIAAGMRPGDGIAYGGDYPRARRGLVYEMRHWKTRPRDVFLVASYAQTGSFTAKECTVPEPCLGSTTRIWLVTTTRDPDGYAELPPATADLLRTSFAVSESRQFTRVRLYLLTRQPS